MKTKLLPAFTAALFCLTLQALAQTPPTPPMPGDGSGGGIIVGGGFGHGFADDTPDPGDGSSTNGTGAPGYSVPTFTTNDLWLDIAAVTNAEATLTIHYPATNADGIFDLYFTTNLDTNAAPELGMTNWEWLTQLAAGQTNITLTDLTNGPYFFVLTSTNFDQNSNSIPDAWEWQYLGGLYASNMLDFSGSGHTILYDYQNGIDPNIIQFLINTTNAYVNQTNAPLSLAIQGGIPFAYAVSLNTNFSAATWQTYTSSNVTASLGTNQGLLTVWVGCRGLPAGTQTWNAICLTLDLTPPSITVTNPATNTLNIPLLQWQGYASEQLSSLTWGLSNDLGSISNQPGYITGHSGNTNYFKCFDIGLGMGVNTLTLHAVDLAGNATNVSYNYTLVSNTAAPALQIWWPQNGTQVGAGSFTLRGYIPDPTVTLAAQIVDTNNNTNLAVGVIERNGDFWVDNIPLMPGSNSLTLTAVDVWGNTNTTNLIVVQSPVQVTINPVTMARNTASLTVEGTINTSNYTIWVNGVEASVSGGTNWTASNVPANGAGMGVIQACAVTNGGGGGSGGGGGTNSSLDDPGNPSSTNSIYAEADIGKQPALVCVSYNSTSSSFDDIVGETFASDETTNWSAQTGGSITNTYCEFIISDTYGITQYQWDTNGNGTSQYACSTNCGIATNWSTPATYDLGPTMFPIFQGRAAFFQSTPGVVEQASLNIQCRYDLLTGFRSVPSEATLYHFFVTGLANAPQEGSWQPATSPIPPSSITVMGNALVDDIIPESIWDAGDGDGFAADNSWAWTGTPGDPPFFGSSYVSLPGGEEIEATPEVVSAALYGVQLGVEPIPLILSANGTNLDPNTALVTFCVGQQVNFTFTNTFNVPGVKSQTVQWSFTGDTDYVNTNNIPATNQSIVYTNDPTLLTNTSISAWWYNGRSIGPGSSCTVTLTQTLTFTNGLIATNTAKGLFNMYMPALSAYVTGSPPIGAAVFNSNGVSALNCYPPALWFATIDSRFDGVAGVTQLITGYRSNAVYSRIISGVNLDNTEFIGSPALNPIIPYVMPESNVNFVTLDDRTRITCNGYTALHNDFRDYIRFQPSAGNSNNNIFVTLAEVNWHIYATADTNSSGSTNYILGTNTSVYLDLNIGGTIDFPIWSNVSTNIR